MNIQNLKPKNGNLNKNTMRSHVRAGKWIPKQRKKKDGGKIYEYENFAGRFKIGSRGTDGAEYGMTSSKLSVMSD